MAEATFDQVVAEIENGIYEFKASGKTPVFDGFLKVYNQNKKKDKEEPLDSEENDGENSKLPNLLKGDVLSLDSLVPTQKFTKPPARYTEATLVKEMEEKGIGRPATYTPTISVLLNRKYTEKEGKFLKPTELAFKVIELLDKYFSEILNVAFTADMEDKLDEIANNGVEWQKIIRDFYATFVKELAVADKSVAYKEPPVTTDKVCDKCGHMMVIRKGRFGEFLACSNFPACKNIQSMDKVIGTCPKCKEGKVCEKHSKTGKLFYGCTNYPTCDFVSWEMPVEGKACPKCGSYLTKKTIYGKLREKCSNANCDYTNNVEQGK